ncbi:RIO-like serine/threonine protein kinase [Phanerochaete sordida]|uniref:Serine/threonine-protein kinase RIO2 n=1 Tax=Phanerochaete sordida TaxID=48140 RepID=A0A9P3G3I1_9APHY|nr:RIO-like serine/threonine protein kinase [Phanerochaete sordida]
MKLDATDLRYITSEEFRVLTAVEMGSKNHEVVPTPLVVQISALRNGGVNKNLGSLAKRNLVAKVQNARYDGYRLTYGGYDYLAMRALSKRDTMYSVGNQIGVGKESDIYIVANHEGEEMVLKLHRLGRVSFRSVKEKRDYMGKRKSASWMYMSRLAAQKEYAFMKVLYEHGFPVPRPVDQARHTILMEFIDAYPLRQVSDVASPGALYSTLMDLIVRFAHAGLIHGDYNEFNILIRRETGEPVVIDFPQMVSTSHANAEFYFNRDVECIRRFFRRRFNYESKLYPRFKSTMKEGGEQEGPGFRLDVVVAASGFKKSDQKVLEEYMEAVKETEGGDEDEDDSEDDGDDDEEEEMEEEESDDDGAADGEAQTVAGDNGALARHHPGPAAPADVGSSSLAPGSSRGAEGSGFPAGSSSPRRSRSPPADGLAGAPLSPVDARALSRSPPASRHSSRERSRASGGSAAGDSDSDSNAGAGGSDAEVAELTERAAGLSVSRQERELRERAAAEASRVRARQQRKYHSKRGAQKVGGRHKGSKAKQDTRVKPDRGGFWD